jgi:hypothetical protein
VGKSHLILRIYSYHIVTGLMISDDTTADPAEEKKKAETVDKKLSVSNVFPSKRLNLDTFFYCRTKLEQLARIFSSSSSFQSSSQFYWVVFLNR